MPRGDGREAAPTRVPRRTAKLCGPRHTRAAASPEGELHRCLRSYTGSVAEGPSLGRDATPRLARDGRRRLTEQWSSRPTRRILIGSSFVRRVNDGNSYGLFEVPSRDSPERPTGAPHPPGGQTGDGGDARGRSLGARSTVRGLSSDVQGCEGHRSRCSRPLRPNLMRAAYDLRGHFRVVGTPSGRSEGGSVQPRVRRSGPRGHHHFGHHGLLGLSKVQTDQRRVGRARGGRPPSS